MNSVNVKTTTERDSRSSYDTYGERLFLSSLWEGTLLGNKRSDIDEVRSDSIESLT